MIPKKIHYFWIGGNEKPDSVLKCIESWKKFCPDYEIIEWNESNYDFSKYNFTRQAYEMKKWAFVTDMARFDVVYENGGVYFDTDVELISNIDSLLNDECFMGIEKSYECDFYVASGLGFGAEKGNPLLKSLICMYKEMNFINSDGSFNMVPTPQYTTKLLQKFGFVKEDKDQKLENVSIYASDVFCPKNYYTGEIKITERTISIHHFDASWKSKSEKKLFDLKSRLYNKYPENKAKRIFRTLSIFINIGNCVKEKGIIKTINIYAKIIGDAIKKDR
ncbi:MAG: glycosyltransferase family 32 protein [Eubacterium sp.]